MRKLVLGALVGFLAAASAALAFDVTFPTRLKVQAHALVDEVGNILLGSTPAKIEVTNLPACGSSAVPASFSVNQLPGSSTSVNVLTVPADQRFVLTNVVIGDVSDAAPYTLSDSSGARLFFTAAGNNYVQNYSTGVPFGPGETVVLTRPSGGTVQILLTVMGRMEPVS